MLELNSYKSWKSTYKRPNGTQHGFATIITAKKIGENCRIYQQVTIGYKNGACPPVLEDNVSVTCGAKVLGDITIHSGSLAAAGAVVVKDVPENSIVVGVFCKSNRI